MPRLVLRRLLGALAAGLSLNACGGGGEAAPPVAPSPPVRQPPNTDRVGVSFGSTMAPSARAAITAVVGPTDSLPARGTVSRDFWAPQGSATPVFAVNAQGDALFASRTDGSSRVMIDARSSALFLLDLLLPYSPPTAERARRDSALTAQASFNPLVDSIAALASRGQSFVRSPTLVAQAVAVAGVLIQPPVVSGHIAATGALQTASASANESVPTFRQVPGINVKVSGRRVPPLVSGGTITLENELFAPFVVEVPNTTPARSTLAGIDLCVVCLSPGITVDRIDVAVGQDGPSPITLRFDKERYVTQMFFDLAGLIFAKIDDKFIPVKANAAKAVIASVTALPALLSKTPDWQTAGDAAKGVSEFALSVAFDMAKAYAEASGKELVLVGLEITIKNLIAPIAIADKTVSLSKIALSFATGAVSFGSPPETITPCFEDGTLYGGCSATIDLNIQLVSLDPGGTQLFTATVRDAAGRTMVGRKVQWSASAPAIVSMSPGGPTALSETSTALVARDATGTPPSVTITAETPTARATATVAIRAGILVATAAGAIVKDTLRYTNLQTQEFRLVDANGNAIPNVDYSQVTTAGNTNSQVNVFRSHTTAGFSLRLSTSSSTDVRTQFNVSYSGQFVQTLQAHISRRCPQFAPNFPGKWVMTHWTDATRSEKFEDDYYDVAADGTTLQTAYIIYPRNEGLQPINVRGTWSCTNDRIHIGLYSFDIDLANTNSLIGFCNGRCNAGYNTSLARQ